MQCHLLRESQGRRQNCVPGLVPAARPGHGAAGGFSEGSAKVLGPALGRAVGRAGREAADSNLLWQWCRQVRVNTTCSQAPLAENTVCNIPLHGPGVERSKCTWLWILPQHPQAGISPLKLESTDRKAARSREGDAFLHPCLQEAD